MTPAAPLDDAVRVLRERIRTHAPERYPVQHATARFHLGVTLLHGQQAPEAVPELAEALALFGSAGMPVERAKAAMMLGVALREDGRPEDAEPALVAAIDGFAAHDQPAEHAAALHNLGVVRRDRGDLRGAAERFTAAGRAFEALGEQVSRASADRELGTTLLELGEPDRAIAPLQRSMEQAGERGDPVAWGAAANALGLAQLALEAHEPAEAAFRAVVSANPQSLRPEGYAMAKANLALVYEATGRPVRARLAGRQARDTPGAPEVVLTQAGGVLERLGDPPGDLAPALDEESAPGWGTILRDEMARWADAPERERRRCAAAWVTAVLERPSDAPELLRSWLEVVLELPAEGMERVLGGVVTGWAVLPDEERDRFRGLTARVLPRFHLPQWQRLQMAFERLSIAHGEWVGWR
jgi:tetratricopeptide (TPR) repeat protein